jgi:hypothetical protein
MAAPTRDIQTGVPIDPSTPTGGAGGGSAEGVAIGGIVPGSIGAAGDTGSSLSGIIAGGVANGVTVAGGGLVSTGGGVVAGGVVVSGVSARVVAIEPKRPMPTTVIIARSFMTNLSLVFVVCFVARLRDGELRVRSVHVRLPLELTWPTLRASSSPSFPFSSFRSPRDAAKLHPVTLHRAPRRLFASIPASPSPSFSIPARPRSKEQA